MKKLFKDWSKYEILLLIFSILIILTLGILFKSNILIIICAVGDIMLAITQAKKKLISQFIGLSLVVFYSIVSYQNKYYGEVLIFVFLMLPLFSWGIIEWTRNREIGTKKVKQYELSKKEWSILTITFIVLFIILYYVLKYFNTSELFVSTLSMVTVLFAAYLIVRRSKYGFLFYLCNDIIVFILWGIPVIKGETVLIPMLINPIINIINDTYAWKSWNKKEEY